MSISISGSGAITGASTSYSFDQAVSIGGTVTYEDVTSVDSVGIITARSGIVISEDNAIHFRGTAADDADAILRASAGGGQLLINSRNDAIINIDSNNDSTDAHFAVAHGAATGSSTELLRVQENGRIGIGTDNPNHKLTLFQSGTGTFDAINFVTGNTNSTGYQMGVNSSGEVFHWNTTNSSINFATNNTERLRITNAGVTSVTGSLSVNDNFYPTTGPLSNRNLIINGAMQVAQRSSSFVAVSNSSNEGYQTIDRFGCVFASGAGGACSIGQSVTVPSNQGFSNSYKLDVTTADTSVSASHYIAVYQFLEAQDVRNSGWNYTSSSSYMTLSFWVRSSKAGTYCCHFRQEDVSDRYYVFEYTLAADTWTKVTHSLPGDSSAVFNNDSGAGLRIGWMLQAGTSRDNATANQWGTSSGNAATSNQVNFFDSTDNDFYLTGVQFEVGERATPFEHRSYGDELAKCERYFEVIAGRSESFMGYAYASASAAVAIRYRTVKRAIPGTVTLAPAGQSTGQITFLTAGGSYPSSTGNNTAEVITAQGFRVTGSSYSGLNANSPSSFYVTGSADQTTTIAEVDAEL